MSGRIALIGFGEVGQILVADLAAAGVADITAFDIAFDRPGSAPSRALSRHPVQAGPSAESVVGGAWLAISAVTAAQALPAARSVARGLDPGAFFPDLNSCSPTQKRAAALAIEARGGRYVEAAVMSPFQPRRIASPMLLGGPHADAFLSAASGLGLAGAKVYSKEIGRAAATKLCRSVIIKGLETLLTEALVAAHHYGVEDEVLASLSDLMPLPDWPATADYMISRSLEHGQRRAEEMREAAIMVEEAGVGALMSRAIAKRQDWAAERKTSVAVSGLRAVLEALAKDIPI
jgi:3-hydroxyisobutyrate dehydrogenase-like beta-hydroxyacid dehydrogenase